jgi:hypothetical protein
MQYSCCGKSAFTKSGRRTLLHAGIQNSGSNPKENAFSLARDVFFDQQGLLRQTFVPELAVLRGSHHAPQRYAVRAGATLPVPPVGKQLEIKARRLNPASSPGKASSWGLIVFGSSVCPEAVFLLLCVLVSDGKRWFSKTGSGQTRGLLCTGESWPQQTVLLCSGAEGRHKDWFQPAPFLRR